MLAELAAWNHLHRYPFHYYTEASINLADDEALLEGMREAGFLHVFIGIDTPDPQAAEDHPEDAKYSGEPSGEARANPPTRTPCHCRFHRRVRRRGPRRVRGAAKIYPSLGIGVAMVGLLQAIPHTQLARRLKAEGRLLATLSSTGNHTVEGINFIPKGEMTKREYLENYRVLVHEIYEPEAYFAHSSGFIAATGQGAARRHVPAPSETPSGALKGVLLFWIASEGDEILFLAALWQILWKRPGALEAFVFDCEVFHHLHQHADYIQSELAKYLSTPAPDDVLDEVVNGRDSVKYETASQQPRLVYRQRIGLGRRELDSILHHAEADMFGVANS